MDNTGNMRLAVVAIMRNHENKILLVQRNEPASPHIHGKWHFPGGGIEFGEHPTEAIMREIDEELGALSVQLMTKRPIVSSNVHPTYNIQSIVLGFPILYLDGEIDVSKDDSIGDVKWFELEEVQSLDSTPEVAAFVEGLINL